MRNFVFILSVFAALVCFEKPAAAQNYAWCAYYDLGEGGATKLWVRNISTMFGRCERGWRELWAQSCVSARAGIVSVDQAPQALFLLKNCAFAMRAGDALLMRAVGHPFML